MQKVRFLSRIPQGVAAVAIAAFILLAPAACADDAADLRARLSQVEAEDAALQLEVKALRLRVGALEEALRARPVTPAAPEAPAASAASPGAEWRAPEPLAAGMRRGAQKGVYVWKKPGDGQAIEIEMVYVPAGDFVMGADDESADEKPKHTHAMPHGYYIGRTDITWGQYRAFCTATGQAMPGAPGWGIRDDHPVVNVSWDEAKKFCDWAGLRLPNEAEWEKAARGTDGRKYPWGNPDPTDATCVWDKNSKYGGKSTAPVGSCPDGASPYGALDMAGNVWQWCLDEWDAEKYANGTTDPNTWPTGSAYRVIRGGSWRFVAGHCRSAVRFRNDPGDRYDNLGFRPLRLQAP